MGRESHILPHRSQVTFWIVNLAAWALLCWVEQFVLRSGIERPPKLLLADLMIYGAGFATTLVLRSVYLRIDTQSRSMTSLVLLILAWSFLGINLWYVLQILANILIFPRETELEAIKRGFSSVKYIRETYFKGWPLLLWSAAYFVFKFWDEWRREQQRAVEAQLLAQKAQLQMLRYQLNPHFLFNALNSIRALVDESRENTKAMITELAEFLRYTLAHRDYGEVPLREELEAIRYYLAIQKRRYEEKLEIRWEVAEAALPFPVPCFLIHPLIENAVKFGMQTSPLPLRVTIEATATAQGLRLRVKNTGAWVTAKDPDAAGTGTGLENVRQRLMNTFPERHRFRLDEVDGQVIATLEIRRELQ